MNPQYQCLTKNEYQIGKYRLVPLREEDILKILEWRNSQIKVLRQKKVLSDQEQINYYQEVILPSFYSSTPEQILFSYLRGADCIGYGGLVHIDWEFKHAEVSFLLEPGRAANKEVYKQDFSAYLNLLKQVAFDSLKFHRIFTETFDIRDNHVSILEKNGFVLEGRMRDHVYTAGKYRDSLIHGCINKG